MCTKLPVCFLIFLAITYSYGKKTVGEQQQIFMECMKESGVQASEFTYDNILLKTPSEDILCVGKCIVDKLEIVNDKHEIVEDILGEYIVDFPEEMKDITMKCASELKTIEKCEDMEKYRQCVEKIFEKYFKMEHKQ